MNVPHHSKLDGQGYPLEEIYAPSIPSMLDLAEPKGVPVVVEPPPRPQPRVGYFDVHPERRRMRVGVDDDLDQFAHAAGQGQMEMEDIPRRSDITATESVYSSGPSPPASPQLTVTKLSTEPQGHAELGLPKLPLSSPATPPTPNPPPQTQIPSPRDLQRQQEVRDRLAGKPGPKASSLIEMYREKERQASGSRLPVRSSPASPAQEQPQEQPQTQKPPHPSTLAAKESTPLPPPPPPLVPTQQQELSIFPTDTPLMGHGLGGELEGEEGEYPVPPNFEFEDDGRESPFRRYKHGAPLHNVVEEEEEG